MSSNSSIEWTDDTWNPVAGCTVVSRGCTNCYAMNLAARLERMGQEKYAGTTRVSGSRPKWNGKIVLDRETLMKPYRWRKPRMVFANSMSDLFHEDVPVEFIQEVFTVMRETPQHTYQVLTKRGERLRELSPSLSWPSNTWMGVSVEDADYLGRVDCLRETGARVKFLSLEPLLGPLDGLDLTGIDWVIAGGESGPGARPMEADWVRAIRDTCLSSSVPFFRTLDGRTWDEFPPE